MNEPTRSIVHQLAVTRDETIANLIDEAAAVKDWDLVDQLQKVFDCIHETIGQIIHEASTGTGSATTQQEGK